MTLDIDARDQTLLATDVGDGESGARASAEGRLGPGQQIDRYIVIDRIGAGASGEVYSAYHPDLDRRVAVKIQRGATGRRVSERRRQRFLREAQALARLAHPNVVTVHDVGVVGDVPFIAMEYVDGSTLREVLARERPGRRRIVELHRAAGRGLDAIHDKQLVHRDFKPDNVMVGADGRVRVMDLGLARLLGPGTESSSVQGDDPGPDPGTPLSDPELTAHGALLGTPAYMAPEQFSGDPVDARTDQFAFCVSLWEALCGQRPFAGEAAMELAEAVTAGRLTAPPPGTAMTRHLRRCLERGLALAPADRWPSMSALLTELARDPARRLKRLGAVGIVAALVGAGFGYHEYEEARAREDCRNQAEEIAEVWDASTGPDLRARLADSDLPYAETNATNVENRASQWVAQWKAARSRGCEQAEVTREWAPERYQRTLACLHELQADLAGLLDVLREPDDEVIERSALAVAGLKAPQQCVLSPPAHDPSTDGSPDDGREREARRLLARAASLIALGRAPAATAVLDEAEPIARDRQAGALLARIRFMRGRVHHASGRWSAAKTDMRDAFAQALETGDTPLAVGVALAMAGMAEDKMAEHEDARWWNTMARSLAKSSGDIPALLEAELLFTEGVVALAAGEYEQADARLLHALSLQEDAMGPHHPVLADTLRLLALNEADMGRYATALQHSERQLAIYRETLGEEHPTVVDGYLTLAELLRQSGKSEEALRHCGTALEIARRIHPPGSSPIAGALVNFGLIENELGDYVAASQALERAVEVLRTAEDRHPRALVLAIGNLANVRFNQSKVQESADLLEEAIAIAQTELPHDERLAATMRFNAASAWMTLGEVDRAIAEQKRALEVFERLHGADHLSTATAHLNLAQAYRTKESWAEAIEHDERALQIVTNATGPESVDAAFALHGLAVSYMGVGKASKALALARRALDVRTRVEPNAARVATTKFLLARLLFELDRDRTRALSLAHEALSELEGDPEQEVVRAWLRKRGVTPGRRGVPGLR